MSEDGAAGRDSAGHDVDLIVVGSGVAGLSAAVRAAASEPGLRVGVVSKGSLADSATQWAQGGVAAVLHHGEADVRHPDSLHLHAEDTMRAGAGVCDREAVEILVTEGPARVRELAALGAQFDRDERGVWKLGQEGGHSAPRVVHAGGAATGAEVERALVAAARETASQVWEHREVEELIIEGGVCRGVVLAGSSGPVEVRAPNTLLASGGAGQLFAVTTNPTQSTGDGLAMALRAGIPVADVEFIQFHPTALYGAFDGPRPLLSEALRGEGALLRGPDGQRFVDEMQPRDAVAAAVAAVMADHGCDHVWLDVGPVEDFATRFPTLASSARAAGLDPDRDWLPVAPAAHYMCGGVLTDLEGATALRGLWAAGEVACTGVHGANRLASNSLLEGMVFGARVVEAVVRGKDAPDPTGALRPVLQPDAHVDGCIGAVRLGGDGPSQTLPPVPPREGVDVTKSRERLQRAMTQGAGVVRDAASLSAAAAEIAALAQQPSSGELANLVTVAWAVVAAALAREETRGGHRRRDFPSTSPAFSHRFVQ